MDLLLGSLGVIEEFFDGARLENEDSGKDSKGSTNGYSISPERISRLPKAQLDRLTEILIEHEEFVGSSIGAEEFEKALSTVEATATMLLANSFDPWDQITVARRVVGYTGRVLVDDPIRTWELSLPEYRPATEEFRRDIRSRLMNLANLRPLVTGHHIIPFPQDLVDLYGESFESINKENSRRNTELREFRWQAWEQEGFCGTSFMREERRRRPYRSEILAKLATAVRLDVDPFDITADRFVREFLGTNLDTKPLRALGSIRLPRLEDLSSADLAALLSSDEVLHEVKMVLDKVLTPAPGLTAEEASRTLDRQLVKEFTAAADRLEKHFKSQPSLAEIVGTVGTIGATLYAGAASHDPLVATGVAAVGGGATLISAWLNRQHTKRRSRPALRVLRHLGQPAG
jgi:hypothetical protein